jgi:hypothetical protein
VCGLDYNGSGQSLDVGSCGHDYETSGFIIGGEVLEQLSDYQHLHGVSQSAGVHVIKVTSFSCNAPRTLTPPSSFLILTPSFYSHIQAVTEKR